MSFIYSLIKCIFIFSPQVNFVGKLLGPKGNKMKQLQEETMCKMAILGRGSMRDRYVLKIKLQLVFINKTLIIKNITFLRL